MLYETHSFVRGTHRFLAVRVPGLTTTNRPCSIYMYQYSNMDPRLSGQTSIFDVVFFVPKSLLGIERQKLEKFAILTRKPRSHVRILIYRMWPISRWITGGNQNILR